MTVLPSCFSPLHSTTSYVHQAEAHQRWWHVLSGGPDIKCLQSTKLPYCTDYLPEHSAAWRSYRKNCSCTSSHVRSSCAHPSFRANSWTVLDAYAIIPLHLVSKQFLKIAHDNTLWKSVVADSSHSSLIHRQRDFSSHAPVPPPDPTLIQLRAAARSTAATVDSCDHTPTKGERKQAVSQNHASNKSCLPLDDVNFYHEYIARHSPLSLSWLQKPSDHTSKHHHELRGLGLVSDSGEILVAPLDDDSVCLWDIGRDEDASKESNGRILARSKPGLVSVHGIRAPTRNPNSRKQQKIWREAIVESVSVDKSRNRAYFAVQSGLNEVDLETLRLVSRQHYPSSISAISTISSSSPLTVATTTSLHTHDHRHSNNFSLNATASERIDSFPSTTPATSNNFQCPLWGGTRTDHAPLIHPPLSVVHLDSSQTIHVAGRFPSILTYDRRSFPKVRSTIHSGARLSSLISKSSLGTDVLTACGEYNGKGSLEIYKSPASEGFSPQVSSYQNRTSAASSKLLSVAFHGTRIVFCDGDGMLKWVEKDGSTPVRRWNINSSLERRAPRGLFGRPSEAGESEVARKIMPLNESSKSELAIWTGEKIGIVGFRKKPRFGPRGAKEEDEDVRSRKEVAEVYEGRMRRALERQADEVRFLRGLGL